MSKSRYFKPMLAAFAVYTLWGFSFLASKFAQGAASPFIILMYRFDIAMLLMSAPLILGRQRLRLRGKNLRALLLLGLCEPIIYFIGEQYGLKFTNSAFSGVMIAVIPIVTLLMAAVFLKERPSKLQWFFSFVSIFGVIAVTLLAGGEGEIRVIGVIFLLLAVVSGSAYAVISRRISDDFSAFERSFIMQLMGAIFFTVMAFYENRQDLSALITPWGDWGFIGGTLFLAVGASTAGYMLYNYAVANAPIANVSALCNLTTVLSVVAGVVVFGEPFSVWQALALIVVLVGIWGVQRFSPSEEIVT